MSCLGGILPLSGRTNTPEDDQQLFLSAAQACSGPHIRHRFTLLPTAIYFDSSGTLEQVSSLEIIAAV